MRRSILPLLAVAALALPGCGSSSSGDSESTGPKSLAQQGDTSARAAFIARADALCAASRAKEAPLRAELDELAAKARREEGEGDLTDATRRQLAVLLGRVVAIAEASQARVRALNAPAADGSELERIFDRAEAAFDASRAYGAALRRHEDAAAEATAEEANAETADTAALAARYGFEVCGSQP